MEKNRNTVNTNLSSSGANMGEILWAVVQDEPIVYEQEDVADALAFRHGVMQKNTLESINID